MVSLPFAGRLMREEGIVARARRRFKVTTMSDHDQPVAANVLDRQYTADRSGGDKGGKVRVVRRPRRRSASSRSSDRATGSTRGQPAR
jgi:transposase InsO family protein